MFCIFGSIFVINVGSTGPDLVNVLKFHKSSKKYCNRSGGALISHFWNNQNPMKPNKTLKNTKIPQHRLNFIALLEPYWGPMVFGNDQSESRSHRSKREAKLTVNLWTSMETQLGLQRQYIPKTDGNFQQQR